MHPSIFQWYIEGWGTLLVRVDKQKVDRPLMTRQQIDIDLSMPVYRSSMPVFIIYHIGLRLSCVFIFVFVFVCVFVFVFAITVL